MTTTTHRGRYRTVDAVPRWAKLTTLLGVLFVVVAIVASCGTTDLARQSGSGSTPMESRLDSAREGCRPEGGTNQDHVQRYLRHVTVTDGGAGMSIHGEGEESPGADYDDVACVLVMLETPGSVLARMDTTRALDGTQDATWDGLQVWWSYHPDSGFNMVVEES